MTIPAFAEEIGARLPSAREKVAATSCARSLPPTLTVVRPYGCLMTASSPSM